MVQLPSASNTTGTLLGGLAGAAIAASAPSWPFVIAGAAAIGMTPVGLAGIMALGATSLINLAVSHIAEVKGLNDKVADWWPAIKVAANIKIDDSYPVNKIRGE